MSMSIDDSVPAEPVLSILAYNELSNCLTL